MGLFNWFTQEIAIDLGTANTLIIHNDEVVVNEPSIVALDRNNPKNVLAVGKRALMMHEKTHESIRTVRPLKDGVIADFNAAELMIREMIKMIYPKKPLFPPSWRMMICIPSSITEVEKRAVRDSAEQAGAKEVYLIHEPMAAALGIGIDVEEFVRLAQAKEGRDMFARMREEYSRRRLLLGVDRLDYSKGLPQRIHAFRQLLERYPENRDSATLIQIASPSREDVGAYDDLRREMDSLCGAINGDFGELDWMPVRYIHRNVARKRLPGLYRASRVALVTPLRDGMNLVAKEFIAAQDPADPGMLVLSRFAGAAEQLKEALLVNPYDTQGTADAIQRALVMPLDERINRHSALLNRVRKQDVHWWSETFLKALAEAEPVSAQMS